MWTNKSLATLRRTLEDMALPVRPVFTPFVVVVGGKYFLPVPGCLLFDREI